VAQRALALDPADSGVVGVAAIIHGLPGGDMETGLALVEKAIGLNRNDADAFRRGAGLYAFKGEIDRAVEHEEQADRLNPLDASWSGSVAYAIAHFGVGDHEKIVEWTARILRERPNLAPALRYRAASLALLGRTDEARQVIARLLEHAPGYTVSEVRRHIEFDMNSPFKRPGVTESLYRGLRLAGLPE
jgi:adenylate cyclase